MEIIYEDLEIDYSNMLEDPNSFVKQVFEKADELKAILKTNNSVDSYIKSLEPATLNVAEYMVHENNLYEWADNQPIQVLNELAERIAKFAGLIRYIARDKAIYELAATENRMDKRTAHIQYNRLRESYNKYVSAFKLFGTELTPLPSMPGNYGGTVGLVNYVFEFDNGAYRNHLAVCKRLGIDPRNLMDTIDYIRNNPDTNCVVKEVQN